ncbi:Fc.00g095630.m01.CDS01 [Cosmosporella sp. VM-42]
MDTQFTVYTFAGSQWAGVMHLALVEKGFTRNDFKAKEIDLLAAENFDVEYLKINPNGTVPSLTSPSLAKPLTESTDILRYLDGLGCSTLVPRDPETKKKVKAILDLVHSEDVNTNIILLQARDVKEMDAKKASMWHGFVTNRQAALERGCSAAPEHPFYRRKLQENNGIYHLYNAEVGDAHRDFFKASHDLYRRFAAGMDRLESLLVLPYAAGDKITEADFHVVPWMSHAMWGAGTEPNEVQDIETLESLINKSVLSFRIGPKTREWWLSISRTDSFKKVYSSLH